MQRLDNWSKKTPKITHVLRTPDHEQANGGGKPSAGANSLGWVPSPYPSLFATPVPLPTNLLTPEPHLRGQEKESKPQIDQLIALRKRTYLNLWLSLGPWTTDMPMYPADPLWTANEQQAVIQDTSRNEEKQIMHKGRRDSCRFWAVSGLRSSHTSSRKTCAVPLSSVTKLWPSLSPTGSNEVMDILTTHNHLNLN